MNFIQETWTAKQCTLVAIAALTAHNYKTETMEKDSAIIEDLGTETVYLLHHYNEGEMPELPKYLDQRHGRGENGQMVYYRTTYELDAWFTGDRAKTLRYAIDYANSTEQEQFILDNVIYEIGTLNIADLKPVKKLLSIGRARLREQGLLDTCSRCGGTGHYSYCQMYGTKCFKCGGAKFTMPRFTKKWQKAVKEVDWTVYGKSEKQPEEAH